MAHAKPTVMFVLDRSSSMSTNMDGSLGNWSRWQALGSALAAALPSVDDTMAIGALLFPTASTDDMNCSVASKVDLQPALGNVATLSQLLSTSSPGGYTPTAQALDTAAKVMLGMRAATQARALVLATDGAPNCNAGLSRQSCRCDVIDPTLPVNCPSNIECLDDRRTEETIANYENQGLPTYVIGIRSQGDTQFVSVLNAMALAGGRPRNGASESYYAATSEAELDTALSTIRDQVGACTFLSTSVPDSKGSIVLYINDNEIPPDQWTWANKANGEVVLLGDACHSAAADSTAAVTAAVACSGA